MDRVLALCKDYGDAFQDAVERIELEGLLFMLAEHQRRQAQHVLAAGVAR